MSPAVAEAEAAKAAVKAQLAMLVAAVGSVVKEKEAQDFAGAATAVPELVVQAALAVEHAPAALARMVVRMSLAFELAALRRDPRAMLRADRSSVLVPGSVAAPVDWGWVGIGEQKAERILVAGFGRSRPALRRHGRLAPKPERKLSSEV